MVGDRVVTARFPKSGIYGFAAVGEPEMAICLLPGTELGFDKDIRYSHVFSDFRFCVGHKIAKFRQFNMDDAPAKHDALEIQNGRIVMITQLVAGQTATVLQLPPSAVSGSPR